MPNNINVWATLTNQVCFEFGKCALNLQSIELQAKNILLSSQYTTCTSSQNRFNEEITGSTLGQLKARLSSSFFDTSGLPISSSKPLAETSRASRFQYSITLSAEQRAWIEQALDKLVTDRNELIHKFLASFDLESDDGCQSALARLQEVNSHAFKVFDYLTDILETLFQVRKLNSAGLILRLERNEMTQKDWLSIAEVLQLIATDRTNTTGDMTSLNSGLQDLAAIGVEPNAYENYGYKSWPDFMHQSGCFDIERRKNPVSDRWEHWYSARKNLTETKVKT